MSKIPRVMASNEVIVLSDSVAGEPSHISNSLAHKK